MKRCTQICLLLLVLCFALAAQAQETSKVRPKLAVLPFQNKVANPYWWHGGAEAAQDVFVTELMKAMQDVFVTELMSAKRFSVMERKELETTAATQQLTLSGDIDSATAIKFGKIFGVNYLLTGAVTEYGVTYKGKNVGNRKPLAVALQGKLIDTSTGEIVWADEARHVQQIFVGGYGGGVDGVSMFKRAFEKSSKGVICSIFYLPLGP